MKTIFRNLGLGVLMAGCAAVNASGTFAQDATQDVCANVEANQALYKKYTDNYAGKIDQVKVAIAAAKEYIGKYEACADPKTNAPLYADQVTYFKGALPEREAFVLKAEKGAGDKALISRIDVAAKAKNVPEVFVSGKEILNREADFSALALDVAITLTTAGFNQAVATPPVDTYNADTINYAKNAIQKIEAGKTSESWGIWSYNLKNEKFQDKKNYALGALNYIIGNITYRQAKDNADKRKEALGYYYKSTQYNSFSKTDPTVYQTISKWYLDEALKIDKARTAAVVAAGNKDTEETLAMFALSKGYADRSIDALARAYKLAKEDKIQTKPYTDGLYTTLKELYAFRYDGKTTGIDEFVATVQSKPLPDPSTTVTPVKEEAPATTTTSETTPANTKPVTPVTKPATTPTKPVSTVTPTKPEPKPAADTTAVTKTKKPAPKKKGTR
ncbi:MAG: hypothetical protein LH614_09375 [Pyrinomonadaceae bacterium]|nr:hypothetical protein [Pyrinomonadaceae bacterium]